jgi:GT2 family glycosyltransferase
MDPRASILVPLSCGPERAIRCLEAIASQPAQPTFEVIVVCDAAPWLEPLLGRLDGDVTVVRSERPAGRTGAVALALTRATAPLCAVLDDAAIAGPGWLAPLLSLLENPSVGTAYVPSQAPGPASPLDACAAAWRTEQARAVVEALPAHAAPVAALALALAQDGLRSAAGPAGAARRPALAAGRHAPATTPELTVVIPTLDATSDRMRRCLTAVRACTGSPHEVVVVDNGTPAQGFSGPVNAGLRAADSPYVVVMNDDVEVLPGWWEPLRGALDDGAAVAFPLTVDGAMRTDFAAWCFAASRETVDEFGHGPGAFFDPALVIWFQDTDLLVRLREARRPPRLVKGSRIRHGLSQTLADPDPALSAWVRGQIAVDQQRFSLKHPAVALTAA